MLRQESAENIVSLVEYVDRDQSGCAGAPTVPLFKPREANRLPNSACSQAATLWAVSGWVRLAKQFWRKMPSSNHPSENEIVIVLQHLQQSEDLNHVSDGAQAVRNLLPPRSWVPGHASHTCQRSAKSPV